MTTTFFAPPSCFHGEYVELPTEEAHHAIKVLRHRVGDSISVVDGQGGWYDIEIEMLDRRRVQGRIVRKRERVGEPSYQLTIALALLKNPNRYDWFLEKAVELGVTRIVPLVTKRTQKKQFNAARAQKRLIAAMKQAGRCQLPELTSPSAFPQALTDESSTLKVICHETSALDGNLRVVLDTHVLPESITIAIGPEGGFAADEIAQGTHEEWRVASLGPRRLRAETAAIVSATTVMMVAESHTYAKRRNSLG